MRTRGLTPTDFAPKLKMKRARLARLLDGGTRFLVRGERVRILKETGIRIGRISDWDVAEITDIDVAEAMGTERAFVTRIRLGHREPSLEFSLKLYQHTGIKIGLLENAPVPDIEATLRICRMAA